MPARLLRLGLVAALFTASGGHLALLQGWAWATMAGRGQSVDGKHPCEMCLKIKRSAGAEASLSMPLRAQRAPLAQTGRRSGKPASVALRMTSTADLPIRSFGPPPLTPPPRSLAS